MEPTNPYQSPESDREPTKDDQPAEIPGVPLEDLRSVARFQKGVLLSILVHFLVFISVGLNITSGPNPTLGLVLGPAFLIVLAAGPLCTLMVARKLFDFGDGCVLVLGAMVPCFGLFALLVVNQRATNVLEQNGFYVGFLGANLSDIDARIREQEDRTDLTAGP